MTPLRTSEFSVIPKTTTGEFIVLPRARTYFSNTVIFANITIGCLEEVFHAVPLVFDIHFRVSRSQQSVYGSGNIKPVWSAPWRYRVELTHANDRFYLLQPDHLSRNEYVVNTQDCLRLVQPEATKSFRPHSCGAQTAAMLQPKPNAEHFSYPNVQINRIFRNIIVIIISN